MSDELMSLELIKKHQTYYSRWYDTNAVAICETAKAAHEWKERYEVADASLAHNEIVIGELRKEIGKVNEQLRTAKAEERERCAKQCDTKTDDWESYVGAIKCAATIRALNDFE